MSNVLLPTPGKERVLFAIENSLLSVDFPPKDGLPHADVSASTFSDLIDGKSVLIKHWLLCFLIIAYLLEQISFQPLVQCLDVDNFIKLFTAVLIERRVLLRSNKYFFHLKLY